VTLLPDCEGVLTRVLEFNAISHTQSNGKMPLKCLSPSGPLFSFDFDRASFERLRVEQATRHHLHFGCCNSPVGLRISSTGLPHFFHLHRPGDCCHETESEMHLRVKETIAKAARLAGWVAETEARGREFGEGEAWTADVLATRRTASIALEVQLSAQTWAETTERQRRYRQSGIRGLWLFANKSYDVCEDIPSFQIRATDPPDQFEIRITPPTVPTAPGIHPVRERWIPLTHFIVGALTGRLHWAPALKDELVDVIVRVKNPVSCRCGASLSFPVGLVVSARFPEHHALVWSIMGHGIRTPAPRWLTPVANYANAQGKPAILIAHREQLDRYTYSYRCPACQAQYGDVVTPHPEHTLHVPDVPLHVLGPAMPGSAEWFLLNRWWLDDGSPRTQ
jgi:hypothetical protein